MAKTKTPSVGDTVRVRYLENPNAVLVEASAKVLAVSWPQLDLEVGRPGRATLRLDGVPLHEGEGRPAIPSWWAAPEAPKVG
jgi:hypothetical protein